MTTYAELPDPVHEVASDEAEERDITIGAVIEGWMEDSYRLNGSEHRLAHAKPTTQNDDE